MCIALTWLYEPDCCVECCAGCLYQVCCLASNGGVKAASNQHCGGLSGNEAIYVAAKVTAAAAENKEVHNVSEEAQ